MKQPCSCHRKVARFWQREGNYLNDITSTSEKENVTTLISVDAAGEIAPSLTIYDRLPAAITKAAPHGWGIGKSDSGSMQSEFFLNTSLTFLSRTSKRKI